MNIGNGYNSAIGNPAFNKNSYNTQTASTLQNGTGSQFYHNPNFTTNTLSNQNNSLLAFNTNTLNNNALNTNALNTNSNIHNANSSAVNPFNTNVFNTNPGSNMPFNSNGVNPNLVLNYPQMNLGQSMPHMNLPTQGLVINDELLCQQQDQSNQYELSAILNGIYSLQQQPELYALSQMLASQQKQIAEEMHKVSDDRQPETGAGEGESINECSLVQKKCRAIKVKNQQLLVKMLNLRQKMTHHMYMHKERSPVLEDQMSLFLEKIREVKMSVSNKCNSLRLNKMAVQKKPNTHEFAPIKVALVQLKQAAEVLERECMRQREELELVIKHVHSQPQ